MKGDKVKIVEQCMQLIKMMASYRNENCLVITVTKHTRRKDLKKREDQMKLNQDNKTELVREIN